MAEDILTIDNLSVYFGKKPKWQKAVDHVSFTVREGEVLGLVGESGCGKTTTGRTIVRLCEPTGGSLFFRGQKIAAGTLDQEEELDTLQQEIRKLKKEAAPAAKISDREQQAERLRSEVRRLRREQKQSRQPWLTKIQMIFQDPLASLDPRMTAGEIIAEGLKIRGEKDASLIREKTAAVLETVGLTGEQASRFPHEFSGGQRQRIGIARALIMEPELIIADEPVSSLDVSIRAQIIHLLDDLRKSRNLTLLFIAHDLSLVRYFADRIAVMYRGRLVELAEKEELFSRPMHPYTQALLSAVPMPDPIRQKQRIRIPYTPEGINSPEKQLEEIFPGHYVLGFHDMR